MKTYWKNNDGIQVKNINGNDIFNLDDTLLKIIYESLKYFREHCLGYPGYLESKEKWTEILKGIEDKFKKVIDLKYNIDEEENADKYLHEALVALEEVFFALWV